MELNSKSFKNKCDALFAKTQNILIGMFVFGFVLERRDVNGERFLLGVFNNPIKDKLKKQWDEDTWNFKF